MLLVYLELLADAGRLVDAHAAYLHELHQPQRKSRKSTSSGTSTAKQTPTDLPLWARMGRIVYAAGFLFKTRLAGWKVFCDHWNYAFFEFWDHNDFPGLSQIRRALELTDGGNAFPTAADMVCWLNDIRSANAPPATEGNIFSAEGYALGLEFAFRERVKLWGG